MAINTTEKTKILSDMEEKWKRVEAVWGGTDAVREEGETYLYRNPLETQYKDRLRRATLDGSFKRTIKKGVGKAFNHPMEVVLPKQLEYLELNCDRSGTGLQTFAKNVLEQALKYGIYYVLIDTPDTEVNSLYQQQLFNVNPYFVGIKPLQVQIIETDIVNNEQILVRFKYTYAVDESVYQAEYLLDDAGVHFSLIEIEGTNQGTVLQDKVIKLSRIPIVPFYGDKIAEYVGTPVLDELIHLVLKHYWKQSELDWNEHFGLTPILQMSGLDSQPSSIDTNRDNDLEEFVLGASTMVKTAAQGDVAWTKADSAGIKTGQESLDRLLKEIDNAGLELTVKSNGTETATGRRLDASEANSILKSVVIDLEWSLYECLMVAGEYLGIDASDADINLDTKYTVDVTDDISTVKELFKEGLLSRDEARLLLKELRFINNESVLDALSTPSTDNSQDNQNNP